MTVTAAWRCTFDVGGAEEVHEGLDAAGLRYSHFGVASLECQMFSRAPCVSLHDLWGHARCQGWSMLTGTHPISEFGLRELVLLEIACKTRNGG